MPHNPLTSALYISAKSEEHELYPFAPQVIQVLYSFDVPERLMAHLLLVHDVAFRLTEQICNIWPRVQFDKKLVLFGAATHDIGKCIYTNELAEEGHKHEKAGKSLLLKIGICEDFAKFAATHASWPAVSSIEELLVSIADKIWKGSREQELEDLLVEKIAKETGCERYEVFANLDSIIQDITDDTDWRLAWQNKELH